MNRTVTSLLTVVLLLPAVCRELTADAPDEGAAWSKSVDGLRWRLWVSPKEVHEGDPVTVTMEFQNVSGAPLRIYREATIEKCLQPSCREADGLRYCVEIEHMPPHRVPLAETVELAPQATHRCTYRATTGGVKPGPTTMGMYYHSPRNTDPEVKHFWTGMLHEPEPLVYRVLPRPVPAEPLAVRIERSRRDLAAIAALLLAYHNEHGAWPAGRLRDFLKRAGREDLLLCRATGYPYNYDPRDRLEPIVYSDKWIRDNRVESLAIFEAGVVILRVFRELPDRKTVDGWIDAVALNWRNDPQWKSGLAGALDVNFRDRVFEEIQRLGCANYSRPVDKAYANLGVGNRNVEWFQAIDDLSNRRAIWCLASGLAHPSIDVRIRCAKALGSPHTGSHFPVAPLLVAARRNAFLVAGSENTTTHGIYQHALADALNAHTRMGVKLSPGQDVDGLKAGIVVWEKWVHDEAPAVQDLLDELVPPAKAADK